MFKTKHEDIDIITVLLISFLFLVLGRNAFGEVRCRGQRYMNIIACDGVEERLLECSYHLQIVNSMNCCGTNPAVVKCMEGGNTLCTARSLITMRVVLEKEGI